MLIYEALEIDHLKQKALIFELIDAGDRGEIRRSRLLVDEVCDELTSHARAEEATLYSRLCEYKETEPLVVFNGFQDHIQIELLLGALRMKTEIDAEWRVLAQKLYTLVQAHVEEEETEVFCAARAFVPEEDARVLAIVFERLKLKSKKANWFEDALRRFAHVFEPHSAARLRSIAVKTSSLT